MRLFERWRALRRLLWSPAFVLMLGLNLMPLQQQAGQDAVIAAALAQYNAEPAHRFDYVEVGRTMDSSAGGVIYMRLRDRLTGEEMPGIVEWLVVLPDGTGWRTLFPGDAGYTAAYRQFPDALNAQMNDRDYREQGDPLIESQLLLTEYVQPWEDGNWATITRSFSEHGTGKIDFDLTGVLVTAAKAGTIVYASDRYNLGGYERGAWWYWNTVVIEHGPYEYSLYGHLAPGSIPQSILDSCSDDLSQPNCVVPVEAGDVIGAEGNTGYSQNPHLHIELGQHFGVVGYPDVLDWNGNGDRNEPAYAAYVWGEHNVAFRGETTESVAAWAWGDLVQAYHGPQPPLDTDLVANGDFSAGTDGWTPTGQLNWSVVDGVMRIARLRTADPPNWAGFQQNLGTGAAANTSFEVTLQLGNSSAIPKYVQVVLQNAAGRHYGAILCEFIIPAQMPLQPYAMRGTTNATWAGVRLQVEVNPPDSAPAALVDSLVVRRIAETTGPTECIAPDA
jgi:murein DD-endopeptidase MepM/ murein hydrolase activator NlpD